LRVFLAAATDSDCNIRGTLVARADLRVAARQQQCLAVDGGQERAVFSSTTACDACDDVSLRSKCREGQKWQHSVSHFNL
jgi:hypothetical protein